MKTLPWVTSCALRAPDWDSDPALAPKSMLANLAATQVLFSRRRNLGTGAV